MPWVGIELDRNNNYLVLNRQLDEETGSMAYQGKDGFWHPSADVNGEGRADFYSQLKQRYSYLDTGKYFSTQGMNVSKFRAVGDGKSTRSFVICNPRSDDMDSVLQDTQPFTEGRYLGVDDAVLCYLTGQGDVEQWSAFCRTHRVRVSPEFQKVLAELGIKNWVRQSLAGSGSGVTVVAQPCTTRQFYAIYVRSPRRQEATAVAVRFVYEEGRVHINGVIRDMQQIRKKFTFLRTRRDSDVLINDQQYFVDEEDDIYISCYTNDYFTPTLIGRNGILEEMETGELQVNRTIKESNSSRLLPLMSYYNGEIHPIKRIQSMICFDLANETFIQYFVPPGKAMTGQVKRGFRVYHLIGFAISSRQPIPTSELINHPITALHFNTLTHNLLRINDNSQSSLLQKVAKVLIEN